MDSAAEMTNEELARELEWVTPETSEQLCAIAEAASRLRALSWNKDMEAAQTGDRVEIYIKPPFDRVSIARWNPLWENWIHDCDDMPAPDYDGDYYGTGSGCVTHWRPLPPKPEEPK